MSQRVPQVMPPKPLTIAIKKALGLPVFGFVKWPIANGEWHVRIQRIA